MSAPNNEKTLLDWLYSTQLFGIKLGLDNVRKLLREMELPDEAQKFIHVAGTNGKGSVCAFIHSIMKSGGINAGLFTSPHLIQFRERVRDTERMINSSEIVQKLEALRSKVTEWDPHPTFFELTFALALDWFRDRKNEWVVLETGLGGRLDATNALKPEVTVITSVSMDHQGLLGESLREIAREKAGIIKPGIPVLTIKQHPDVMEIISMTARERGAPLQVVTTPVRGYELGLAGQHQLWNAALAVAALKAVGLRFPESVLRAGLKQVDWPARFQRLDADNRMILDGAHNIDSAETLVRTWQQKFPGEKASIVFGAASSKDVRAILRAMQPIAARWHFTGFQSTRSAPPAHIREVLAAMFGPSVETHVHESPDLAIAAAKKGKERTLITGSLYLAGEVLAHVRGEEKLFQATAQ
ncbi:MAG: bifunctional folylpolyglutamate synthase/dihydrofolate synthase [Verrucomicrobiaceae bacterium]|nr:bifunctional folylpolyglutamate synthase/dihydrofolate synthase [Verrucomicrobiaceae bacterium]